jgi:hypothetical protein
MTARLTKHLRQIYYEHGLITFLFMFAPLLPGFVEKHTHLYLLITQTVAGDVHASHEAVKLMFGRRGLNILNHFKKLYKPLILAHPNI